MKLLLHGKLGPQCATVALTTTHPAAELDADVVVRDLAAVSVLVGADGVTIETDDRP